MKKDPGEFREDIQSAIKANDVDRLYDVVTRLETANIPKTEIKELLNTEAEISVHETRTPLLLALENKTGKNKNGELVKVLIRLGVDVNYVT